MALAFTKCNGFIEHLAEKVHDMDSDTFILALSNTAPASETNNPTTTTANCLLANVTQIAYTNLSSRTLAGVTGSQTNGVYTFDANDITLTASGGAVAAWRYIYIYNSSATLFTNPLLCYFDNGSSVTLQDGQAYAITWNASGIFTATIS